MRVIGGEFRGRRLTTLSAQHTRPTTDRVREAWASTMQHTLASGLDSAVMLDAFAGSGALGIEMLSRGASHVVFCEQDAHALRALRENLSLLGLDKDSRARVVNKDVFSAQAISAILASHPFDVIILDPPYATPVSLIAHLITRLAARSLLKDVCVVSYEHAALNRVNSEQLDNLLSSSMSSLHYRVELEARKKYGTIELDYIRIELETL